MTCVTSVPNSASGGVNVPSMNDPFAEDAEYAAWARTVPPDITTDTIWRTPAYRLSLFMMSRAQGDMTRLFANRATRPHVDQLLRAVGAISADLDEGYSRSSGPERAHYYEYGCGSARESRGWYYKCAVAFSPEIVAARLARFSQIIRILTAIIPRERERRITKRTRRDDGDRNSPPDRPAASSTS